MICEKIYCEWHSNPLNCVLHVIAFFVLVYALWIHNIRWIIIAVLIAVFGHVVQALANKKTKAGKRK